MKNRAVKEMFSIQHNCKPEDIEVEYLATLPGEINEFKVSIQKDKTKKVIVFKCKTEPYDPSEYIL